MEPVPLQGAFSYTVAAGKLLVQFRVPESLLDTKTLGLARKIYGDVVPACFNKGVIGPSPSLTVYVMDKIPGITYIEVPLATLQCIPWQEKTVSDYATYFQYQYTAGLRLIFLDFLPIHGSIDFRSLLIPPSTL